MAKSIRPVIGSIAIVLLGYGVVAAAAPGDPLGPAFAIHPPADSLQNNPDIAARGDGFVVAWHGALPGTNATVHARRFSANGTPMAPFPDIEVAAPVGLNKATAVAANASGQFAVLWSNLDQSPTTIAEQSVRSFGANGSPLGPPRNLQAPGFSEVVAAIDAGMSASGNFVAVFQRRGEPLNDEGISARRFAFDASPIDSQAFPVGLRIPGEQMWPHIAVRSDGSFVISWTNRAEISPIPPNRLFSFLNSDFSSVRIQPFSAEAEPLRREVAVDKASRFLFEDNHAALDSAVAASDSGRFAVTWMRSTRSSRVALIRPYSAAGYPLRLRQRVDPNRPDIAHYRPDIAVADDGSYYAVTWIQTRDGLRPLYDIPGFFRLFDESGEPLSPVIRVSVPSSETVIRTVRDPAVAILSDGNIVVSWQLELDAGGPPLDDSSNIMVRLFEGP